MKRDYEWDSEPWGDLDQGLRRRWRRAWHQYAAVLLGFAAAVLLVVGALDLAVRPFLGGACLAVATYCVVRADGPRPRTGPPQPPPTRRQEATWLASGAALLALGVLLAV